MGFIKPGKFYDHDIVDQDNLVVGHLRVKPSRILWAPKNSKIWYGVTLVEFARFAEEKGKEQKR